jgi:hypothetical protein
MYSSTILLIGFDWYLTQDLIRHVLPYFGGLSCVIIRMTVFGKNCSLGTCGSD